MPAFRPTGLVVRPAVLLPFALAAPLGARQTAPGRSIENKLELWAQWVDWFDRSVKGTGTAVRTQDER